MRGRPLRHQLVAMLLAVCLGLLVVVGGLTVVASQRWLLGQLDRDVVNAAARTVGVRGMDGGLSGPGGRPGRGQGPLPGSAAVLSVALADGQVVTDEDGRFWNTAVNTDNESASLDAAALTQLQGAAPGALPETVDLGGDFGAYRVVARESQQGYTVFTGLPVSGVEETVRNLATTLAAVALLGLLAAGLAGTWLVRRNLEPLAAVAGTARAVSRQDLHSGEVTVTERVPGAYTDPGTEVGQVGLALNQLLDTMEGALRSRHQSEQKVRQFVADASHELRTPLASIRGYAELSRREPEAVPPVVRHALTRVESEALRMQGLVEDLLLLARLDAGRPLEREPVDLTRLAMDAVSDARAAGPDHRWELRLPTEPVEVPGDQARLHQLLANLLANARTHTPAGTRVVTIVEVDRDARTVQVVVSDDGPGVPPALRETVFERFTRGDDSRSREAGSTGLGLSIVAAVAQAHGGAVALVDDPSGTTFTVTLPRH